MPGSTTFRRDALLAGLFYLGLAITGACGYLLIRAQLFAAGDPEATVANLLERNGLARTGIALEFGTVLFQALAAVWLGKLFREVDAFAAGVMACFGMVNAIAILVSAALMQGALETALGQPGGAAVSSYLLYLASGKLWEAGALFFGLWLIPMGWLVWKSALGHRALGWILILGGIGYVLNLFIRVFAPGAGNWVAMLSLPATVGEFWMIGLLIWTGLRRRTAAGTA